MRMSFRTLVLCGLLLLALPCLAATPGTPFDQNGFNPRMLDASVPQAERLQLFAHVIQLAEAGQVKAMDLAGTMYWQGTKLAGSPVTTNLAQAQKLLANAAIHGDVLAMAKLAELQLAAHELDKAMIWAQLYAHYMDPTHKAREAHGREYVYASDLMERINAAGGKIDNTVQTGVNNVASQFDASIRAGIETQRQLRRSGAFQFVRFPELMTQLTGEQVNLSGWAEYMVAFNPDGSIQQVWPLASWPMAEIGRMLRPAIDRALANKSDAGAGMRYRVLAMPHYAHKARSLEAHH